jgi:hypothetical protein
MLQIPFLAMTTNYLFVGMIVRIVIALIVFGNKNTSDDFETVYRLKYLKISFSNTFKRDFRPLE